MKLSRRALFATIAAVTLAPAIPAMRGMGRHSRYLIVASDVASSWAGFKVQAEFFDYGNQVGFAFTTKSGRRHGLRTYPQRSLSIEDAVFVGRKVGRQIAHTYGNARG